MNDKEIIKVVKELQATTKRKEKEEILKNNEVIIKDFLCFLLDDKKVTGLSTKKIEKDVPLRDVGQFYSPLKEIIDYLTVNKTGRDEDISIVKSLAKLGDENFLLAVATKSLPTGCDAKTINKVFGKQTIPTFDVMLAEKYVEIPEGSEFILTQKLDGMRCLGIKENGKVTFYSREGNEIEELVAIQEELENLPIDNIVLDGELLALNHEKLETADLYRKTMKLARTKGKKINLEFMVFDSLPLDEFREGLSKETCKVRKDKVKKLLLGRDKYGLNLIKALPELYRGTDQTRIPELLSEAEAAGLEGLMLNLAEAFYEGKRTKSILKLKTMQDCDLLCTGVEVGEGALAGTLGAIYVDYKGQQLKVGSGFKIVKKEGDTNPTRDEIWANKDLILGKIIKVAYFEESKNQNGGTSLRFPVFKEIRTDKTEPSYN